MDSRPPLATTVVRPPTLLLAMLALLVLGAGGYAAWRYAGSLTGNHEPAQNANVGVQPPEETPSQRDQERFAAVNVLKIALAGYYGDAGSYPDELAALAPTYAREIPRDPWTKEPYGYVRNDRSYTITFTLEAGVLSLAPGEHTLSPNGFDVTPAQSEAPADGGTTVQVIPSDNPVPPPSDEEVPNPEPPFPTPVEPSEPQTDTDGDGVPDAEETQHGSDPNQTDTDGDGLADGHELYIYKTNPASRDTDDDGFSDGEEVLGGFDPTVAGGRWPDTDGDGASDPFEQRLGTDPRNPDTDGDGLTDADEARVYRTDPLLADTDGDGFNDGQEIAGGYDPNGPGTLSEERRAQHAETKAKYDAMKP